MPTVCAGAKQFENIQAIIFDKDGTLANCELFLWKLAQRRASLSAHMSKQNSALQFALLQAFGIRANQIDPTGLMAVGTRLENEIVTAGYIAATGAATGGDWTAARHIARSAFLEADICSGQKAAQTPLVVGVLNLIQTLVKAQIKLAILSSDSASNVREFTSLYELEDYFEICFGVDANFLTKSDPKLLHQVFTMLEVTPDKTLMIGDSAADVEIARRFGLAGCIGFTGGWSLPPHISGADIEIAQFESISIIENS